LIRPTLVVFDLDDTLYEYAPAHRAGIEALSRFAADELGVKAPAFEEALTVARERVKQRLGQVAASHSRLLYCHEALELIGLRSEPHLALRMEQEYWRTYLLAVRLRPGVEALLDSLRFHGAVTAIVTDLTAQIQFRKLTYLGLAERIDHVVCSEETAAEKASLHPFDLLFERVAEEATREVWFIGDQPWDAPIDHFVETGRVRGGRGLIRGAKTSGRISGWSSMEEIGTLVDRVFGT
jgi:FMN phosphatase YigB (HAD superfamily)